MRSRELVAGTQVGGWRVLGRHEEGTFGVVYLAVRAGEETTGPYALKLARSRGDARLEREAELLARVRHPNVPRLRGAGEWDGFPYVVMDWVAGVELYRWARLGNPSRRQAARLLAKLAGALGAVHAVGAAHRDLKGDNVLVRLSDGEPLLTDFGAGTWTGAAPLTVGSPPGTPLYYSPERLRAHLNLLPPETPHGAGPADDVYGLGVTAWRLLTDRYPFLEWEEAQRTQERLRGALPRAPHEVTPGVPPELGTLVLRMMAAQPEERQPAQELARALEALEQASSATWEEPLFAWEPEPSGLGPGRRHPSRVEYELRLGQARVEQAQVRVAAEVARVQAELGAPPRQPSAREPLRVLPWRPVAGAALGLAVLGAGVLGWAWRFEQRPSAHPAQPAREARLEQDGGTVGVGDTALAAAAAAEPSSASPATELGLKTDVPRKPLQGQKRPPCHPRWEVEINGGCWVQVKPPCTEGGYERQGHCYLPVNGPERPTTSEQP